MKTLKFGKLKVDIFGENKQNMCWILSPLDGMNKWVEGAAGRHDTTIAVVSGMDWDNDLTPWPAPGQPPGSPDFKGDAPTLLNDLCCVVIPQTESSIGVVTDSRRTLVGISLSGLFTLWQWALCDVFYNIISISGSFWYENFTPWIVSHLGPKPGKAVFLLGDREAQSHIKAFQCVAVNTQTIITFMESAGINTTFVSVRGDHYENIVGRLETALSQIY